MAASAINEALPRFNNLPLSEYGNMVLHIGAGTYGAVKATDKNYIIKIMGLDEEHEMNQQILSEIIYPSSIHHPGIIRYHDVFIIPEDYEVLLVMDRYEGDLSHLKIASNRNLFLSIAKQLITSVAYLTSRNIIHRDIKPENIFYNPCPDQGYKCVIGDFGLASGRECMIRNIDYDVYTLSYRPPEILLGVGKYTASADVWALGCTLYYIYTGETLFEASSEDEVIEKIISKVGYVSPTSSLYQYFTEVVDPFAASITKLVDDDEINDLLVRMLNPDPKLRESIFTLQYHPIFNDVVTTACYNVDPIPINQCIDRARLFERSHDYILLNQTQQRLIAWMLKMKDKYKISSEAYVLAVDLLNRYLRLNPILDPNQYQLTAMSTLYLASIFLDYFVHATINTYIYMGPRQLYTEQQMTDMCNDILRTLNFDLLATTPHDKIMSQQDKYDSKIIKLASKLLVAITPISALYINPNIVTICINVALLILGRPYNLDPGDYDNFRTAFKSLYTNDDRLWSILPSELKSYFETL